MTLLNGQVWNTLELVRLRQIPWHKRPDTFDKLQAAGLLESVQQKTLTVTDRPAPLVAVLTERGKEELIRLSGSRSADVWCAESDEDADERAAA